MINPRFFVSGLCGPQGDPGGPGFIGIPGQRGYKGDPGHLGELGEPGTGKHQDPVTLSVLIFSIWSSVTYASSI